MRFEKVAPENVFKPGFKHTKLQSVIEEFIAAEIPMAKIVIENGEYASVGAMRSSLHASVKRYASGNIKVKTINNEVYLINLLLLDKEYKVG